MQHIVWTLDWFDDCSWNMVNCFEQMTKLVLNNLLNSLVIVLSENKESNHF